MPGPVGVQCQEKGTKFENLQTSPGYYRATTTNGSLVIGACPVAAACQGGDKCGRNRTGLYCAHCDPGFSEWGGQCVDCRNQHGEYREPAPVARFAQSVPCLTVCLCLCPVCAVVLFILLSWAFTIHALHQPGEQQRFHQECVSRLALSLASCSLGLHACDVSQSSCRSFNWRCCKSAPCRAQSLGLRMLWRYGCRSPCLIRVVGLLHAGCRSWTLPRKRPQGRRVWPTSVPTRSSPSRHSVRLHSLTCFPCFAMLAAFVLVCLVRLLRLLFTSCH